MFPSPLQPLVSLASGAAVGVEPLLTGAASSLASALSGPAARVPPAPGVADSISPARTADGRSGATTRAASKPAAGYAAPTSAPKPKTAAAAKSAATTKSSSTAKKGPLAFLDDTKLSVEEKLMRLLAYLNDKLEKDMQKKMKEMGGGEASGSSASSSTTASSSGSSKKSGGLLGSVLGSAKELFPVLGLGLEALQDPTVRSIVSQVSGPVLAAAATAVGLPALAPALLEAGPAVVDAVAGAASALSAEDRAAAPSGVVTRTSTSAAASGSSQGSTLSQGQERLKLMEIQRIVDQQREMFSLVSGILRARHDARMAVIQNVR